MAANASRKKTKTTALGVAIAILIGGYTMLRPTINEATGWNLPAISQNDAGPAQASNAPVKDTSSTSQAKPPSEVFSKSSQPSKTTQQSKTTQPSSRGPLADRMSPSKSAPPAQKTPAAENSTTESDSSLKYGLLQEVSRDRYMSPAGLLYTPGSAEGHRLEHLKRHTADQPGRPGKHGVFDGGMEGALESIEKAYEKAKAKQRTTVQVDGNRTIYTVDMGKRVGYIGGRDGNQKRKPMARRIRLVVEGNRVITAFPL